MLLWWKNLNLRKNETLETLLIIFRWLLRESEVLSQNWAVKQETKPLSLYWESNILHCPNFIRIPCHPWGQHGVTWSWPGLKSNSLTSVRDPPDSRNGSPSLGHSLNPSLSATAAAAIRSKSKEKIWMTPDYSTAVHCLGHIFNKYVFICLFLAQLTQ